jgi:hypothetical protein
LDEAARSHDEVAGEVEKLRLGGVGKYIVGLEAVEEDSGGKATSTLPGRGEVGCRAG